MNNEEQLEGNKLIALFMGYAEDEIQAEEWCGCNVLAECAFTGEKSMVAAAYDSNWSWLMPVLEKIEAMDETDFVSLSRAGCSIFGPCEAPPYIRYEANTKIQATWLAVVAFIKWHQTQTT